MAFRRKHSHGAEVPTHSLNDIMFFLLLFFLIISTMTNPNVIKILTSSSVRDKSSTSVKKEKYELKVTAEKEFYYNEQKVTAEDLQKMLVSDFAANNEMVLTIDMDKEVDIQTMVDVLSVCKESKVKYFLKDPRM